MTIEKCSICGEEYYGWGNNAFPVTEGRCCDKCNDEFVIPVRIEQMSIEKTKSLLRVSKIIKGLKKVVKL